MSKTFTAAIKDFSELPEKTIRGTCIGMGSRIIKRSPVDTGRFRNNWQFSIDAPATGKDPGGANQVELVNVSNKMVPGNTFYMTNNLPYAERLEYGWSKQAPKGMVRVTLGEYKQVIEEAAKK
jgi:hypothetical protein